MECAEEGLRGWKPSRDLSARAEWADACPGSLSEKGTFGAYLSCDLGESINNKIDVGVSSSRQPVAACNGPVSPLKELIPPVYGVVGSMTNMLTPVPQAQKVERCHAKWHSRFKEHLCHARFSI